MSGLVLEVQDKVFPLLWLLPCGGVVCWNAYLPPMASLVGLSGSWLWMLYFTFMGEFKGAGESLLLSLVLMATFWIQVRRAERLDQESSLR